MRSPTFLIKAWNAFTGDEQNVRSSYNSLKSIDVDHERCHAGKLFGHTEVHSIDAAETYDHLIVPNSGSDIHLRKASVKADGGPGLFEIYEDPFIEVSSYGTNDTDTWYNANRQSANVVPAAMYDSPGVNVSSIGELIYSDQANISGTGNSQEAQGDLLFHELILDPSKLYLIRYTNNDSVAVTSTTKFLLYDASED